MVKNVQRLGDDFVVIWPVIGCLLALIAGGVVVAEKAIFDLTGYARQVEFINFKLNGAGAYTFYLMGKSITFMSLIHIGKISLLNEKVFLEIGGYALCINTCPVYDVHGLFGWLGKVVLAVQQGLTALLSIIVQGVETVISWLSDYLKDFL